MGCSEHHCFNHACQDFYSDVQVNTFLHRPGTSQVKVLLPSQGTNSPEGHRYWEQGLMTLYIYVYLYFSCVICLECPQNSCRLRSLNPSSLSKHSTSGLPPAAPCKEEPHLSEDNPCQTTRDVIISSSFCTQCTLGEDLYQSPQWAQIIRVFFFSSIKWQTRQTI